MFENPRDPAEVERIREWAKTPEYREKNFAREALTVNPAKACQPLGAVFAAVGFEKTIPFVHGSQGCVAYYRSHFSRHFKEPSSCVSSSMTEDAAVFGGLNNMIDGLANTYHMYKPTSMPLSRLRRRRVPCQPSSMCHLPIRLPLSEVTSPVTTM
jgi:nitrogenase molybdenum-iron protein beta chain